MAAEMIKRCFLMCLCVVMLVGVAPSAYAQKKQPTIQELNDQIAKTEEEIKQNEELLKKIKKDKSTTQNELKLVRSRINSRQKLVASLNSQMNLLTNDISLKTKDIARLEKEAAQLRKEYGDMVYSAYKNHLLNNSMSLIFSAEDFNDVTKRIDYMRRYNNMRQEKVMELETVSRSLSNEVAELEVRRQQLDKARNSRDKELKSLRNDESNYQSSSKKLANDEKKVATTIKQKEAEKKKAEGQLQKVIAEEAKKAKSKQLSAEDARRMKELSGKFDQNKGKFPYPVPGGVIIDRYGKHQHPTQKNLTVENKGVNIMGERGAEVRSIYEGVVTRIVFINGLNNCVMVQHGEYFAVYSNLVEVNVKANDKVIASQPIGKIPSTDDNNDYFVHFELWKGTNNMNPEPWFYR